MPTTLYQQMIILVFDNIKEDFPQTYQIYWSDDVINTIRLVSPMKMWWHHRIFQIRSFKNVILAIIQNLQKINLLTCMALELSKFQMQVCWEEIDHYSRKNDVRDNGPKWAITSYERSTSSDNSDYTAWILYMNVICSVVDHFGWGRKSSTLHRLFRATRNIFHCHPIL